ncbi:hypothetical protein KBC80_03345 [Candidatus Woesebacteria bacterium]|nr:hypothetical protein [Candidatus Woesebacteria bacterium]
MNKNVFIVAVNSSRALSQEQKELFLEGVEDFSDEYRAQIIELLTQFDQNSFDREKYLREKLYQQYKQLEKKLANEGVEESEKQKLLEKAKKQMESFFPQGLHA